MYNLRWTCEVMKCSVENARVYPVTEWSVWDGVEISDLTDLYEVATFFDDYFQGDSFLGTGEYQLLNQSGQVVYHRRYGDNPIHTGFKHSMKERSELEI